MNIAVNHRKHRSKAPPGDLLAKYITARLIAKTSDQSVNDVIRSRYGDSPRLKLVTKAATSAATTSDYGSQLLATSLAELIESLKPVSIFARLRELGEPLEFGNANELTLPRRDTSQKVPGSFVEEGKPVPVKKISLASRIARRSKVKVITTFSHDILELTDIESAVRAAIAEDTANAIDGAMFDGQDEDPGVRPPSILYGVTGQASAGTGIDNIITDLKYLVTSILNQNGGKSITFLMHPTRYLSLSLAMNAGGAFIFKDELEMGVLMERRFLVSTNVPVNQVVAIEASEFISAIGSPRFEFSTEAALVMADDDGVAPDMPLRIDQAAGAGAQVHSMFQHDAIALKMILPVAFYMKRAAGQLIDQITGATW